VSPGVGALKRIFVLNFLHKTLVTPINYIYIIDFINKYIVDLLL
jgi:hypothetical protein